MADAVKEVKPKKEKAEKVKVKKAKTPMSKEKLHKIMFGTKDDMGLLKKIVVYVILTCVGFVFVYPLLKVLSTSFMSLSDLVWTHPSTGFRQSSDLRTTGQP